MIQFTEVLGSSLSLSFFYIPADPGETLIHLDLQLPMLSDLVEHCKPGSICFIEQERHDHITPHITPLA